MTWSNYRSISLNKLELKILAKILVLRLNPIIAKLIHKDQVGFILIRQAGNNIRRATLLFHRLTAHKIPTYLFSLDIRKPFDSVSWSYLKYTLQR